MSGEKAVRLHGHHLLGGGGARHGRPVMVKSAAMALSWRKEQNIPPPPAFAGLLHFGVRGGGRGGMLPYQTMPVAEALSLSLTAAERMWFQYTRGMLYLLPQPRLPAPHLLPRPAYARAARAPVA